MGQGWVGLMTYTTVSTVCPAALLRGLVDLDVLDDQIASVKTLGIGVGLGVLQEVKQELGRLDGPPSLGNAELLACSWYQDQHQDGKIKFSSTDKKQFQSS